jgi:hypothetical protein
MGFWKKKRKERIGFLFFQLKQSNHYGRELSRSNKTTTIAHKIKANNHANLPHLRKIPSLNKMAGNISSNLTPKTDCDVMPRHSACATTIYYIWRSNKIRSPNIS